MGIYLNPGFGSFEESVNSEIFVDKTEMILYLNSVLKTQQKYVSVSRPRRFGKTMTANMLCAYYGKPESANLFKPRLLSKHDGWDRFLGKFNVIRLVMTKFFKATEGTDAALKKMQRLVCRELCAAFPGVEYEDKTNLIQTMEDIFATKNTHFVVVIDEWDAIFREKKEDKEGQEKYLDFLRDWFKDNEYIALAYMTGILPIKKYGRHSALNMFDEYSIVWPMQLAPFTGFTEDEVIMLCRNYGRDIDKIRHWYDGYDLSDVIPPDPNYEVQEKTGKEIPAKHYHIYSPLSVVKAITTGYIQNYWNKTESYEALAEYIRMNLDGLKDAVALMMDGGSIKVDISTYQNDMTTFTCKDDVLALLINLGYLKYNSETNEASIPNKEILEEFKTSTKSEEWVETFQETQF